MGVNLEMGDAQEATALETLENALDTLLSNYDPEYYSQYVGFVNASPNPMEFVRFKIDEDITAEEQEIIAKAKANGTYLKAPNGKPSNLTPRQWVQVRTKAFKRWFGDWELANLYNRAVEAWNNKDSKGKVVFGLSDRAKARFAEILGKDIKQLVITDDSIRHIKNYHSQNEELRGQKDMLPEDVVVIPYLINNYDFMNPSPDHNDKMGNRAIEIRETHKWHLGYCNY